MNVYRLLFGDLLARLGWRLPALIALMTLVGLGEGMSVALLLPLLSLMGLSSGTNSGLASQLLGKGLSALGATGPVGILVVIFVISTAQTALFIGLSWWSTRLARHYQAQRQAELFRALMGAKWSFVVARKAGELTNAVVTEAERLGTAFTIGLSLISTAVVMVTYFALSLLVAWQVTLCLAVFAVVSALAMARLYRRSYAVGQSLAPFSAELQSTLAEQFAAFKIIKATVSEQRAAARIDPLLRHLERALALVSFLPAMVRGLLEFLAIIGLSIIVVLASRGMGVSVGNVVVVLALFARLFPRITALQGNLHYLNGYVHGIESINQLQSAAEAETERQDSSTRPLQIGLPTSLIVQNLEVKFGERKVLDRVDVKLSIPGMLAVVGGSGAGKSTLVHTLLGLVEPSAGSIRLEKHEIHSAPLGAWRRTMGYVPQETMLFHASLRENLTLANPDASAAEIETAARRAHAQEFIDALPEGLDTVIGDQGVKLSGGQRQRLGIARALLTKPILLLLDEAMSALDSESEAEVLRTIEELRKEMGILIVSHRLAPVQTADAICVIEAGRVVETGTWSELMARRTRLHALAEAQSVAPKRSVAALR
jgi:ATP-binding cassette subfamily C protein